MPITVRYSASLRERIGREKDLLLASAVATVADVWKRVSDGQTLPPNALSAVNMEYVNNTHPVRDGDEVAFLAPVTGG